MGSLIRKFTGHSVPVFYFPKERKYGLCISAEQRAFSVSLANGFHEPGMGWKKISFMAGIFAFFQWLMPMAGWICVHIIVEVFQFFASYIPWIACFLLCFIGVSMVKEGFSGDAGHIRAGVGKKALLLQGVATSIDALSAGFTN